MTDMALRPAPALAGEAPLSRWWRTVDRWTLSAVLILFLIGMLLGFAASPPLAERKELHSFHFVYRQAFFGTVALAAMFVLSLLEPRDIRRLGVLGFGATLIALALLPVFGTDFGKGAVRWFSLRYFALQPSEFLKPAFVIFVAWLMSASFARNGPPGKVLSFAVTLLIVGLLAIQPDFGQASLVLATWGVMYFVAGAPILLLLALAGLAIAGGAVAYQQSEHFARRIDGYFQTEIDPTTQIGYAMNAINEGGFFGVGVGQGTVKWRLPDAHTDFIVAVAAEEYGLILIALIIALFLTIALSALRRLIRERDPFIRLAGTGLATVFALQAMINMGVAVRLLPAKGMTLPFISYGGSSLIAAGAGLGMLLALTRTRPQDDLEDAFVAARHG